MQIKLYNLSYGCPRGGNRDKDCPFWEIEHLSFKEKIEWIDQLDDKKKKAIYDHHLKCTKVVFGCQINFGVVDR